MAISVVMPALELTQETGKLVVWRKKEGQRITKGEVLLEVETDKAVVEIEAAADGVLAGVKALAGDVIAVGKTIAWIISAGEVVPQEEAARDSVSPVAAARTEVPGPSVGAPEAAAPGEAVPQEEAARDSVSPVAAARTQVSQAAAGAPPSTAQGAKISPKARRLAREHNIDITRLRGTGPDGEILASDILAFAESASKEAAPSAEIETLSSVGRLMAERTTQSWTSVPHFFVVREIDAGPLVEALEKLRTSGENASGVRITHTDLLVALVARVLKKHPRMNASWAGTGLRTNKDINVALAMAVNDGVVTGVIHNADTLALNEVAAQRRGLAERAKAGQLRPADIAGATFTISNLGMYRVDAFSAIIVPPQAGILAVGSISDRVVPVDGRPGIRPMMTITLSCDHRFIDGARAAQFLNDLAETIREPNNHLR
jgi:pyruvate dehydrogenase E2 component (dihydrolipoamide acetyltransferase)